MTSAEKILLIQVLLEDIRGNWGDAWSCGKHAIARAEKAKELCIEVAQELDDLRFIQLSDTCDHYLRLYRAEGNYDGRYFRDDFPFGYCDMNEVHKLSKTMLDKSTDFQKVARAYLTYPENRFTDYSSC